MDAGGDYFVTVTDANQCTKVKLLLKILQTFNIIEGGYNIELRFPKAIVLSVIFQD